ncbi:MAG: HAD hydrolase-like protein [Candidatus Dojkabacteria bacterium]|nr:MAG: HAD hydrolase-like protein [Candidatus Dojkabacteria bacterium]
MEKYNLRHYFGNILGVDVEKSKVIKLQSVQKLHHNREMYFITDTLGDIREAEKVGIEAIAVTWGYHDKAMLEQGNPRAVVNSIEELAETVTAIISQ